MFVQNPVPHLLVVTGPTGSGKSKQALLLAKQFDGEIVNADSIQLYRDCDIGSAKPTSDEFEQCPHHLFSIIDPNEEFDVAQYRSRAAEVIKDILKRGRLPIVVGGSGMYIRALLCGLVNVKQPSAQVKEQIREREQEFLDSALSKTEFCGSMHEWLAQVDPESASRISPTDLVRIRRSLLVKLSTGSSFASLQAEHRHAERNYRALVIILLPEREALYAAINRRVDEMLEWGMVGEVKLLQKRYPRSSKIFSSIGYRHVTDFLENVESPNADALGDSAWESMVEKWKCQTRNFAKRQVTWWKNEPRKLGWVDRREALRGSSVEEEIARFLKTSEPEISYLCL